jgi:phosphodiesterase/alkaline phosphatase D-like protein
VTATPGGNSATVAWSTDEASTSRVDYGTSATALSSNASNATLVTSHSITLSGLTAGTTYFFRVTSADGSGNSSTSPVATSSPASFATADTTPPVISTVTATPGISGTATISWTTSEPANSHVDYGTSSSALNLNQANTALVTAHSITLSGLTVGVTYYYRVTSADALGNTASLPSAPATANFVEVAGVSVWNDSATPGAAEADPAAVELGMKFRSDVAGVVTGVRFHKASTNTGTHTGHLWSSTGTLLGSVTFAGETASGWQTASFATPIPIAANTTYVVSYFAPNGYYSSSSPFFSSTGVDAAPLHALASGVDGLNGVYNYGSESAFPESSWNDSNYWVDLVFFDNVPPAISALTATATATAATITWSTNEASNSRVDYGTSADALTLSASSASMVTAHSMSLTGLTTGLTYYYRVTSTDAVGNTATLPIQADTAASFTATGATPPVITAVTATPGSDTATVAWSTDSASTSRVDYGTSATALSLNASNATLVTSHSITLTGLTAPTTYYFRVTSVDGSGNSATSPVTSSSPASFTTVDTTAPVITAVTATPGSNSATIIWSTNEASTSRVDYGTSAAALSSNASSANLVTGHSVTLTGLTAPTTYYFRVTSVDASSNSATSPVTSSSPASFTTVDTTPPVISVVTAVPGVGGTATISWTTSEPANSHVDYGTSSSTLNLNQAETALVTAHSITLSGLTFGTTYYYRVSSTDASGNAATSPALTDPAASFAASGLSIFTNQVPAEFDHEGTYEIGTKFWAGVNGQITQVRLYTGAAEGGDHSVRIWRVSDSTLLAGPFTWNITSGSEGWKSFTLPTPLAITANTDYIVAISNSSDQYYAAQENGFDAPIVNGSLHTYVGSGVYTSTLGTMPTESWENSNYFRDIVFVQQ